MLKIRQISVEIPPENSPETVLKVVLFFFVCFPEPNNCVCRYEFFFKQGHILFTCIMSVIIPLILMSILYGFMATEARKHVSSLLSLPS